MLKKSRFCLVLMVMLTLVLAGPGNVRGTDTVTLQALPQGSLQVDGDMAVWMSADNGNWDIYCLNRKTGEQKRITDDPATQGYPDIAGNYIVWQDNRNHIADHTGKFDIYLYNLQTGIESQISKTEGDHQEPVIAGNRVVWIDHQNGSKDVILYDLTTDTVKRISADNAEAFGLLFDGEVAAWTDTRNTSFDVYYYVVATGAEKRLTYGFEDEVAEFVIDGKIVYSAQFSSQSKQIYMFDTAAQLDTRVTTGNEIHESMAFNGQNVMVEVDGGYELSAVDTFSETKLAAPVNAPKQAFMFGDEVVWYDGQGVASERIADATERAKLPAIVPAAPTTTTSSGGKTEPLPDSAKEYIVKSDADTVIASSDGKMSLSIPAGSFASDTSVFLQQEPPETIGNFSPFSPSYKWWVKDNLTPKQPLQLTITYNANGTASPLGIGIFNLSAGQPQAMRANRDKEAGKLTSLVGSAGKVSLMVYNKYFPDMKQHWAAQTVSCIASHQIIQGHSDGNFKPDNDMTRAEFVKVLVSSVSDTNQNPGSGTFSDVKPDFWAASYIDTAYQKEWITGYNGKFEPNEPITRQQMAAILIRVLKDIDPGNTPKAQDISAFADKNQVSSWAQEPMSMAIGMGIIQGYNNRISPEENATRAEAATMLLRYLDRLGRL